LFGNRCLNIPDTALPVDGIVESDEKVVFRGDFKDEAHEAHRVVMEFERQTILHAAPVELEEFDRSFVEKKQIHRGAAVLMEENSGCVKFKKCKYWFRNTARGNYQANIPSCARSVASQHSLINFTSIGLASDE